MRSITTPLGRFPVGKDGERALEQALQTGERYSFKLENGRGEPIYLTGRVRRDRGVSGGYVLDLSSADGP